MVTEKARIEEKLNKFLFRYVERLQKIVFLVQIQREELRLRGRGGGIFFLENLRNGGDWRFEKDWAQMNQCLSA